MVWKVLSSLSPYCHVVRIAREFLALPVSFAASNRVFSIADLPLRRHAVSRLGDGEMYYVSP